MSLICLGCHSVVIGPGKTGEPVHYVLCEGCKAAPRIEMNPAAAGASGEPPSPGERRGTDPGGPQALDVCEDCGSTFEEHSSIGLFGVACPWTACRAFVPKAPRP